MQSDQLEAALAALQSILASKSSVPVKWGERAEAFLASRVAKQLEAKTVAWYAKYLSHFVAHFGTLPPDAVTAEQLELTAARTTWGPNTRRNYLSAVCTFLAWCGVKVDVKKPGRESAGAELVISEAAYNQALGAARGELRPLLAFLWHTGCRPSEACKLTAADVDWDTGTVTLREHKTRRNSRGRARIVYLSPAALEVARGQRERHPVGLLFPNRAGGAWRTPALTQALWRISERIGQHVTAYGFRHSYATRALEKGVPDTQVAALLGHSSTRMLHAHYAHVNANARLLKEAAARVSA
jgi:integrase